MNTRLVKYISLAAIVLEAAACSKAKYEPDPSDVPSGAPLVTVLYDPGALGDRSYNDLIYSGVEQAALARGLRTMQITPSTTSEGLAILGEYFRQMGTQRDTVRRLLIVAGAEYEDFIRRNSSELEGNPLADLLFLETEEQLEDKGSTLSLPYYGAMYEAGAVSRVYSDEVLLIAANPKTAAIQESIKGFTEGFDADYLKDEEARKLRIEWLSDDSGGGFKIDDSDAMRIVYDGEQYPVAQLIFPVCGGASGTFYRLSDLFGGFDYIGIDAASLSPHCPFSVVKHIDWAMDLCIGEWMSPDGMPKHQSLSFEDGWTEFVLHPYTERQRLWAEYVLTDQLAAAIHEDAVKKEAENE